MQVPDRLGDGAEIIAREPLREVGVIERLLVDGGELRIATDDPDYRRWILAEMLDHGGFEWLARRPADWRERPADWPPTRYEQKARAAGRNGHAFPARPTHTT